MKTHELLELASLDALGLLDEHEREAFDRAFAAAPPAVQAQIRREQTRISRAEQYLPEVDAPVSLRAKVLAAVQQAMEAVTGARRGAAALPALLPSRGVSPAWRGAAVACAAAAIVFGFAGLRIYSEVKAMDSLQQSNMITDALIKNYGTAFNRRLMDPNTQFVSFSPVARDAEVRCAARLLIDPKTRTGYLYCSDLPKVAGGYSLAIIDEQGRVGRALITFEAGVPILEQTIPGLEMEAGSNLAIVSNGANPAKAVTILKTGSSH